MISPMLYVAFEMRTQKKERKASCLWIILVRLSVVETSSFTIKIFESHVNVNVLGRTVSLNVIANVSNLLYFIEIISMEGATSFIFF